ncbi:MAG TPA: hypothetical protein DDW52_22075 [Planctomycetaceae bacterium]|nr:hypothetical protein [Planctomycetaceae bacterium]
MKRSSNITLRTRWLGVASFLCLGICGLAPSTAHAEEPYERYLDVLKQNRLFDQALIYVDMLVDSPTTSEQFRRMVDLQRGILHFQAAAVMPISNPAREPKLNQAENFLRKFIDERSRHPRRAEARLKLGQLLQTRAEEAQNANDDPSAGSPEAVKFFGEAHELFEGTIAELAELIKTMRGARVDPNDTQKVELRARIQREYREAQFLSAKALENRGWNQPENSPKRKADLNKAVGLYNELHRKDRETGIRNYALFYRSLLQSELGQKAEAIDGLQRVADLAGDLFRPIQTQAVKRLVELRQEEEKFKLALERGESWLEQLRPAEETTPEAVELKLAVARLKLDWADSLRKADRSDRAAGKMTRDVRSDLRRLLQVNGPHVDETRELLARAGVEVDSERTFELPTVKDFDEAYAAATERIGEANSLGVSLAALQERLQAAAPNEEQSLEEQLQLVDSQRKDLHQQAIQLLQSALQLFTPADNTRNDLFDARFQLGRVLLLEEEPWQAIAIGELLAFENPASAQGLNSAAIALGGISDLLTTATPARQAELGNLLEPLSIYLAQEWPDSSEATAATAATVQLALVGKNWDKAEQLIDALPAESPALSAAQRDMGLSFYSLYSSSKLSQDEEEKSQVPLLANKAKTQLSAFWAQLPAGSDSNVASSKKTIDAGNALSQLYTETGELEKAQKTLLDGDSSVLSRASTLGQADSLTKLESYRLAIQLYGRLLTAGKVDAKSASETIAGYIAQMQEIAKDQDDGSRKLASVFVGLARGLNDQMSATKVPAQRKKLFELLTIVAEKASLSDSFSVRFWAADTLLTGAEELAAGGSKALAGPAFDAAASILESISAKEKETPGWIDPPELSTRVKLLQAQSLRSGGDYKSAVKILGGILKENPRLLDAQIEAAKALQAWGADNSEFYKTAYEGGPGRSKLFWGWGKIAEQTMRDKRFSEQFFTGRFGLALNRYLYGKSKSDQKIIAQAERDIAQTSALYPELGGPEQKRRFETLLNRIRKDLGK